MLRSGRQQCGSQGGLANRRPHPHRPSCTVWAHTLHGPSDGHHCLHIQRIQPLQSTFGNTVTLVTRPECHVNPITVEITEICHVIQSQLHALRWFYVYFSPLIN